MDTNVDTQTMELFPFPLMVHVALSRHKMEFYNVSVERDIWTALARATADEIYRVVASLPSDPPTAIVTAIAFAYPASWWQAFKAEWMPDWFRKRFPVRLRTVVKEAIFPITPIYPQLAGLPEFTNSKIVFHVHKTEAKG